MATATRNGERRAASIAKGGVADAWGGSDQEMLGRRLGEKLWAVAAKRLGFGAPSPALAGCPNWARSCGLLAHGPGSLFFFSRKPRELKIKSNSNSILRSKTLFSLK